MAAHSSALRGGFVWLDHAHIENELGLVPLDQLWLCFTRPFAGTGFYRPLMTASLSLDAALGGATWLYHATNLGFHALASLLVLVSALRLGSPQKVATLAALLFAAHPLTSSVAAGIAFRSEAMLAVMLLGLVSAHLAQRSVLAGFALLGGCLTKETAFALGPLFILSLELRGATRTRNLRSIAAEGLGMAAALGLRAAYARPWPARFPDLELSEAIGTRLATLAESVRSFVIPRPSTVCDAFPVTSFLTPLALLGLLLGLLLLRWAKGGGVPLLLLIALLPSLQLVPTLRWWSSHYLYVPLAFASILAAHHAEAHGRGFFQALICVALAFGALSWFDGKRFHSDASLWLPEVSRNAACREGHFYLGEAARKSRQLQAAADAYEQALAPRPGVLAYVDVPAALQNLGVVRASLGQLAAARSAFEAALAIEDDELTRRRLRYNLAVLELKGPPPESSSARRE